MRPLGGPPLLADLNPLVITPAGGRELVLFETPAKSLEASRSGSERPRNAMPAFDFRGLRCFASPSNPRSYCVLPTRPHLRRDQDHRPLTTVVDAGSAGYLLLSATWDADRADLEALRTEIATRTNEEPSRIVLSLAALSSVRCHALMGDGSGSFQTAGTSTTSGIPPYDAVFNVYLHGERLANAKAALRGEQDFLAIEYRADVRLPVSATATFDARAADLVPWLKSRTTDDPFVLLGEAVECGLATVAIEVPDDHARQLAVSLYERVLARAAQMLAGWLTGNTPDHFHVTVRIEEEASQAVRAFADVGAIVSQAPAPGNTGVQDAAD